MRKRSEVRSLQSELEELERTDPEVGAAAEKLERAKREILSKPLKAELGRSDIVYNPHQAVGAELDPAFARIVERVFIDQDADKVYEQLEKDLRVGEKWEHPGAVMRALDKAETNARLAHRLYVTAKIERERWELENEVVFGAMRLEATRHLQLEKDEGKRSKQITDADVVSMCAQMYPDQYVAQEVRRRKVKAMEDSLSHLCEVWLSRCRTLQVMVGRSR